MDELAKIRFMTTNYSTLQGLRIVPVGLALAGIAAWSGAQNGPNRDLTWPVIIGIAALLLYWAIDRYYAWAFGRVQPAPRNRRAEFVVGLLLAFLALLAFALDTNTELQERVFGTVLPFSAFTLVAATGMVVDGLRVVRPYRAHWEAGRPYLVMMGLSGLLLILFSFFKAFPVLWLVNLGVRSALLATYLLVGVVMVAMGVAGHVYLTQEVGVPSGDVA